MDYSTSPSPCDRPVKRQRRVLVRTHGCLIAEFIKLLHYNDVMATPFLKLLDL
ncbi:unnamed protein product [Penicillium salamii]|nr:unnamed protein product [Penicillium salamii]